MKHFAATSACLLLMSSLATEIVADDLSSVYIDPNPDRGANTIDNPTLDGIESVVAQGGVSFADQIARIVTYLEPILEDDETKRFLVQVDDAVNSAPEDKAYVQDNNDFKLKDGFIEGRGVAAFGPILNLLESNDLPSEVRVGVPENLKGLALYPFVATLRYALCLDLVQRTIDNNGTLSTEEWCEVPRLGKITRYDFDVESGIGDFDVSDMTIDRYKVVYDTGSQSIQFELGEQWSLFYKIAIQSPGYDEGIRREQIEFEIAYAANSSEDPFKPSNVRSAGTLTNPSLPAFAKYSLGGDSIWARGLDRRLFAYEQAVVIEQVTRTRFAMRSLHSRVPKDGSYGDISGRQFVRNNIVEGPDDLDSDHPYLQTSDIACIDIMFAGPFPTARDQFPHDQVGWCLGRCAFPAIENSK